MKKLYFSLLIFIFSILISFLLVILAEIYLRYIGLGDPIIYEKNITFGYSPKPNQEKKRFNNSIVKINESGLRSNSNWSTKKNINKILFIGDSVTYGGSYIDNSKLFSERVCQKLGKSHICGNAGVNAYGILNMVLRSKYDYRIKDADTVIITIIAGDFNRGITDSNVAHYFLNEPRSYFPGLEEAISFIGYKYDINNYISKIGKISTDKELIESSKYGATEFSINALNDEVTRLENLGKKVFVFYSPDKSELSSKVLDKQIIIIKNSVKNLIDMSDDFMGKDVFYDGVHYNQKGHDLVSNIMLNLLN